MREGLLLPAVGAAVLLFTLMAVVWAVAVRIRNAGIVDIALQAGLNLVLATPLLLSSIPATEAQALRSRGDDYREYQRTTRAFVPWFPRR